MEPKILYSLDEIVLIPKCKSLVSSRGQCDPYYGEKLPLFIAPMSCLVDEKNYDTFNTMGFNTILPRTVSWEIRKGELLASKYCTGKWVAIGLEEGESILRSEADLDGRGVKLCIDVANGHQSRCFGLVEALRKKYPQMTIMVGNIANPEAYLEYARVGADYVRIGIGSGQVCTTSVQTGNHYPMASLIMECRKIRQEILYNQYTTQQLTPPYIVADGGFGYIDQIVKAIALGADYVMIGRIAATFPEACGITRFVQKEKFPPTWYREREYYGMSTEKAQKLMHPEPDYVPKHSEGTVKWVPVRESTQDWIEDFTHALRSCMSYQNAFDLFEFKGHVDWGIQNPITFNAYVPGKHTVPGF